MQVHSGSGMALMRIDLGITQQQLADTLGVSRALVAMAERGHRNLPGTALPYLQQLLEIAHKLPAQKPARRPRRSTATKRPIYNRIRFSTRGTGKAKKEIVTITDSLSILTDSVLQSTAEKLNELTYNGSKNDLDSRAACTALMISLLEKREHTSCRIAVLELDKTAAIKRGKELRGTLSVIKAQLKAYRLNFKTFRTARKKWRARIAGLYVKKLAWQAQLEKYNKPSIIKRKQAIEHLQAGMEDQQKMLTLIQRRVVELGEQVLPATDGQ